MPVLCCLQWLNLPFQKVCVCVCVCWGKKKSLRDEINASQH